MVKLQNFNYETCWTLIQKFEILAMAVPPLVTCSSEGCPVLLALHGAGVEASSPSWTDSYQRQNHSWVFIYLFYFIPLFYLFIALIKT